MRRRPLLRLIATTVLLLGAVAGGLAALVWYEPAFYRASVVRDVAERKAQARQFHDRLQNMINSGMTLEQVKAARPTRDYDPIYGSNTGNWTTDMFIEAAYKSLGKK